MSEPRTGIDWARAQSLKPLTPEEIPYAEAFGNYLRTLRLSLRYKQKDLALDAMLHRSGLGLIEKGARGLRASTIRRLAEALAKRSGADVDELYGRFIALASGAIRPETEYPERTTKRREKRSAKDHQQAQLREALAPLLRDLRRQQAG
jgi:transcriptional regulator with XRE-family HTH domain